VTKGCLQNRLPLKGLRSKFFTERIPCPRLPRSSQALDGRDDSLRQTKEAYSNPIACLSEPTIVNRDMRPSWFWSWSVPIQGGYPAHWSRLMKRVQQATVQAHRCKYDLL